MDCNKIGSFLIFLLALCFLILAIILPDISDRFLRKKIKESRPLVNGTRGFEKWTNPSVPVYIKFHFFNVTNPMEFLEGKVPVLQEVGPYVFRQKDKFNIYGWQLNEETLSFNKNKSYYFEPSLSAGSDTDIVTVFSLPLLAANKIATKVSGGFGGFGMVEHLINGEMKEGKMPHFLTHSVRELLFDGFGVDILQKLVPETENLRLFSQKNNTPSYIYTIFTGKKDIERLGRIALFNGTSSLSCWKNASCNAIKGSDGTLFHPFINRSEKLEIYAADLRRSIYFEYEMDSDVEGIPTYKFVVPKAALTAPSRSELSSCYCTQSAVVLNHTVCDFDGLLDVSSCLPKNLPVVISLPHFYTANQSLIDSFIGLSPSKEKHETLIEIEPITGIVLKGRKRIQINALIQNSDKLGKGITFRDIPMPVMWIEEAGTLDAKTAAIMKATLFEKIALANTISLGCYVICTIFLVLSLLILVWPTIRKKMNKSKKQQAAAAADANKNYQDYTYQNLAKGQAN